MKRAINLRQIEAFKAVVEVGTVSGAAELLCISQPTVSKLLAYLEQDSGLELFDRVRGRLIPTTLGMRLYGQVDRIFVGLKQVEHAVEMIRREEGGRISVGVLPAFSGMFISHATKRFLADHADAHVSIIGRSSEFICQWLISKHLDIGIVNSSFEHPQLDSFALGPGHLVCIVPRNHRLAKKRQIAARDLDGLPFVGFPIENPVRQKVEAALEQQGVRVNTVIEANLASAVSEMVADGLGVSVLDPLLAYSQRDRLAMRTFLPQIQSDLRLCCLKAHSHSRGLIDSYIGAAQGTADEMFAELQLAAP